MRGSGLCTCLGRAETRRARARERARVLVRMCACAREREPAANSAIDPHTPRDRAYHGSREAHFQGEPRVGAITPDDSGIMHRSRKARDTRQNLVAVGESVDVHGQPPRRHAAQHHARLRTCTRICRRQHLRQTPRRRRAPRACAVALVTVQPCARISHDAWRLRPHALGGREEASTCVRIRPVSSA